jgi:hypothetical protein
MRAWCHHGRARIIGGRRRATPTSCRAARRVIRPLTPSPSATTVRCPAGICPAAPCARARPFDLPRLRAGQAASSLLACRLAPVPPRRWYRRARWRRLAGAHAPGRGRAVRWADPGAAAPGGGDVVHLGLQRSTLGDAVSAHVWTRPDLAELLDHTLAAWESSCDIHQRYDGPWADLVHFSGRVLFGLVNAAWAIDQASRNHGDQDQGPRSSRGSRPRSSRGRCRACQSPGSSSGER